jgi:seryl-tRNA synthetase
MFMDSMLDADLFPIRYLGYSSAFRREAGSYGKDTKGMIRQHQFDKIEMETFTTPEQGMEEHLFMVAVQEYLLQQLELPYEVMICCTGDM